ncbi:NAD-dependent succinate-semialdehyde dehydrogenase [Streptomyces sp. GMR22]|uniref:NAD-dependent succinate-semialdehyde dehydrogenase n=1 Tax=Streptomyces sp. GMR22 TaxID=2759524 RepID=UPI0015FB7486|nr:NAD-dependent succinate-semialdehyde dehydrogenase [Streptomyces sp. GMR22]MBA6434332.1 NAD-dependent succinate-semialdehyde dehydrogenase [Streptomyces sp. GMR22]
MSTDEARYRALNPATGQVIEDFAHATDTEIQDAIAAAHAAFEKWRRRPIAERAAVVARLADLFTERVEELAGIITLEMGKRHDQAVGEAEFSADIFRYFAEQGERLAADQAIPTFSGGRAVVQRRPVGVLLGVMPWNYPYYQVARFAAPNLVLGNTILLKHAESCPYSALAIRDLMLEAGVPAGVYENVFASHNQVADIIADDRVQGVSVTGSERAGAAIGALAGKHLKKAVLELGGSDPYIVLDADDVAEAATTAWETRMENTGQACNSNKRMIVAEPVFADFVAGLVEHASGLQPGDPAEAKDGTYAPMSSRAAAETLHEQVQDAVAKGATLHTGGELSPGPDAYYSPAVLTGVTPGMRAYSEELFGPVAVVYKAASDQEALDLANSSRYGLGGAVFSTDVARATAVAAELEVGMANVNTPVGEGAELPFGGVKRSGFGRELGPLGMDEFVNKRLLYISD